MCCTQENGISTVLVINMVSILASLALTRVWILQFSLELGVFFRRSNFFIIIDKMIVKHPSLNYVRGNCASCNGYKEGIECLVRSYIGKGKSQSLIISRVRVLGSGSHPHLIFLGVPSRARMILFSDPPTRSHEQNAIRL